MLSLSCVYTVANFYFGQAPRRALLIRSVTTTPSVGQSNAMVGSVRSQGSLPRAPPADRFSGPVLRDQESRHELPALPIIVDHRAGRANGSWLPALSVPGLRAAVQRADWHGGEPGPSPDRHRVSLLAAALQAEPAGSGRDVPDPRPRVHP